MAETAATIAYIRDIVLIIAAIAGVIAAYWRLAIATRNDERQTEERTEQRSRHERDQHDYWRRRLAEATEHVLSESANGTLLVTRRLLALNELDDIARHDRTGEFRKHVDEVVKRLEKSAATKADLEHGDLAYEMEPEVDPVGYRKEEIISNLRTGGAENEFWNKVYELAEGRRTEPDGGEKRGQDE